ncbi:MAG: sodium-dependent transporter [Halobacteria archaeon]
MSQWSSSIGFIFAVIGSAVGLGNIWRFPITVQENGGGAYLLPYLTITFLIGLPMMIVAVSAGRKYGTDVINCFNYLKKGWVGWIAVSTALLIQSFYVVIMGWILAFAWFALTDFTTSFASFTNSYFPVLFFLFSLVLTASILALGVEDGIERLTTFAIPTLFVSMIALTVYSMTLSGFWSGFDYFLSPNFSVLDDPDKWDSAFGQSFFSLTIGSGVLVTYGSYLEKDTNIPKMSVIITCANVFVAFLAGLIIFPLVFTYLSPSELEAGRQLAFTTFPKVFANMPYGELLGLFFFLLLYLAALSTSVGSFEVPISVGIGKGLSRIKSTVLISSFILLLGIPSVLSYTVLDLRYGATKILDLVNSLTGSYFLPVSALLMAVVLTWIPSEPVTESRTAYLITKFVTPVLLIIVIITSFLG